MVFAFHGATRGFFYHSLFHPLLSLPPCHGLFAERCTLFQYHQPPSHLSIHPPVSIPVRVLPSPCASPISTLPDAPSSFPVASPCAPRPRRARRCARSRTSCTRRPTAHPHGAYLPSVRSALTSSLLPVRALRTPVLVHPDHAPSPLLTSSTRTLAIQQRKRPIQRSRTASASISSKNTRTYAEYTPTGPPPDAPSSYTVAERGGQPRSAAASGVDAPNTVKNTPTPLLKPGTKQRRLCQRR